MILGEMPPNGEDGIMANGVVDPDQTAPPGLQCLKRWINWKSRLFQT